MKITRLAMTAVLLLAGSSSLWGQEASQEDSYISAPINPAAKDAVEGINRFTLDLYKHAAKPGQNIFLSPASVSTAVALAYRGAKGPTADELRTVLRYTAPPESYLSVQAPILRAMSFAGSDRSLSTNNSIWVQNGLPMNADYLADIAANAGAGLQRIDYRADPEAARLTINGWVERTTGNRIKNLLSENDITVKTRAALVNTIYWKGGWSSRFAAGATRAGPFHLLDGRSATTNLMNQTSIYRVLERDGVKAINMPYGQGEVSMVVLMPNGASALPRLEQSLTSDTLEQWIGELDKAVPRKTVLTIPKMHLEWRDDLVPTFEEMGVHAPFGDGADFSGMATIPYPGEIEGAVGLNIQHIIHQTFLDVDEKGSEAAAATAVVMDVIITGARRTAPEPPPFVFRADKPFLFLLRDGRTGMILFIGHYVGPATGA